MAENTKDISYIYTLYTVTKRNNNMSQCLKLKQLSYDLCLNINQYFLNMFLIIIWLHVTTFAI